MSEGLTGGFYPQHHLRAPWEDKLIKEASGVGCIFKSEFPQGGEANPSMGEE